MQNLSLLVVENQPLQRQAAVASLLSAGAGQVHQAAHGTEALERLERCGGVDVAICNLRNPGMDGAAFLGLLGRSGLARAVMLCEEADARLHSAAVSMIRCFDLAFAGDLGMPLDPARLRRQLQRFTACGSAQAPPPSLPVQPAVPQPSIEDIRLGLARGEFVAHYQPKFWLRSGEMNGAEVLARWEHPRLGLLGPASFLPTMEASGLIDTLFVQLLEQGLALQRELARYAVQIELAFNVQASQLARRFFAERIRFALAQKQLPASGLTFEVTETGEIGGASHEAGQMACSLENMLRLRLMGCGLALDDLGKGHSSLARLCDYPFNQVKLDAAFVHKLDHCQASRAVIGAAVALSQAIEAQLVAEGVETAVQKRELLAMGCEIGQGFALAMPMPGQRFLRYCME